jgi:single-stranded-DNA-specific exonuclease
MISGSARLVLGFDVYKVIESCCDILENFGGHTYAVGLIFWEENLPEFRERFKRLSFDGLEPKMMSS